MLSSRPAEQSRQDRCPPVGSPFRHQQAANAPRQADGLSMCFTAEEKASHIQPYFRSVRQEPQSRTGQIPLFRRTAAAVHIPDVQKSFSVSARRGGDPPASPMPPALRNAGRLSPRGSEYLAVQAEPHSRTARTTGRSDGFSSRRGCLPGAKTNLASGKSRQGIRTVPSSHSPDRPHVIRCSAHTPQCACGIPGHPSPGASAFSRGSDTAL